jgi:hypothetical protein
MLRCPVRPGLGQPGQLYRRWAQGWWRRAFAGVRVEAGAPQGPLWTGWGVCGQARTGYQRSPPRPVTQWVGDGSHGLTEPDPEPKRAVIRRRQCPVWWIGAGTPQVLYAWTGWGVCGQARTGDLRSPPRPVSWRWRSWIDWARTGT